ncbi:MAG TPA: hypothetical protein VFD95_04390 [Usitatibacter sp.]|jgi:Ca2+-binding EF-hand superfamily protein|nr:hypothetical protein [Usitatibacter sp.]
MKTVAILTAIALGSAATLVIAAQDGHHGRGGFERLKAADTNGDGLISRAEAAALPRLAERFDAIDANRDGQVSRDEMRAFHQAQRLQRMGDLDGDGKLSKAEALAKASDRFERADANKDGFVTPEELRAARGGHKGKRHG